MADILEGHERPFCQPQCRSKRAGAPTLSTVVLRGRLRGIRSLRAEGENWFYLPFWRATLLRAADSRGCVFGPPRKPLGIRALFERWASATNRSRAARGSPARRELAALHA